MSNKAITWAYQQSHPRLKAGPKFVLVALADLADQDHSCYPGVNLLSHMTSSAPSTVKSNLDLLHELKFITSERRHRRDGSRTSNRYYLTMNRVDEPETESEILGPESGPRPFDQVQKTEDLSPENGNPRSRIWGGILEPLVNPQIDPSVKALVEHELSLEEHFESFWTAYPRHQGKAPARVKFAVAAKKLPPAALVAHAIAYRDNPNREQNLKYVRYAAAWLHQEGWADVIPERAQPPGPPGERPSAVDHNLALVEYFRNEESHGQHPGRPALDAGVGQ